MKQKLITLITVFVLSLVTSSCIFMGPSVKGNGNVVEENRKAGKFDEIKVSRGMNVYISQGEKNEVVVKADENLLEYIETDVDGRSLKITVNRSIRKATSKKVFVTVKDVKKIQAMAGSNVFSDGNITCENIDVQASAGSNIKVKLLAEKIDVSSSAGSNVKIDGKSNYFYGKASAGSNVKAEGLSTKNCEAKTSSGSNIWIRVTDDFHASASSGGNIFYYGSPKNVDTNSSSGGNVIKN